MYPSQDYSQICTNPATSKKGKTSSIRLNTVSTNVFKSDKTFEEFFGGVSLLLKLPSY